MPHLKHTKLISAIVPKGVAPGVIDRLQHEKGITTANFTYARGIGKHKPMKHRGIGEQTEKEILSVVVDEKRGDEIFEYIYEQAEIDRPHGGYIYMQSLSMSADFVLPDIVEEKS